jgi:hypothetical protein
MSLLIVLFCSLNIDPRFDVEICVDYMSQCIEKHDAETCAEFYDEDFPPYYGDPAEADLSY